MTLHLIYLALSGTLQVVVGTEFFDTSNYQILRDPKVTNDFTHFAAKCTGEPNLNILLVLSLDV